jgi:hypothetical protein
VRSVTLLAVLAVLLAGCAASQPQIIQTTVEVTRMVEVTRIVEATRLVEVTPAPTVPAPDAATPTPGTLQVKAQLILFWVSKELGQVNVRSTNASGATISGLEYHCTVTSLKTGELLADQIVVAESIPPSETNTSTFAFTVRSEHMPGYFQAECESGGVDPVSAQSASPGNQTSLPGPPVSNGTAGCAEALQNNSLPRNAYIDVRRRYDAGNATYNELAGAYSSALMTYYVAVNACR